MLCINCRGIDMYQWTHLSGKKVTFDIISAFITQWWEIVGFSFRRPRFIYHFNLLILFISHLPESHLSWAQRSQPQLQPCLGLKTSTVNTQLSIFAKMISCRKPQAPPWDSALASSGTRHGVGSWGLPLIPWWRQHKGPCGSPPPLRQGVYPFPK